jgi:hypothetical protein
MALYKLAVYKDCMEDCMTERKGYEEGASERRGGTAYKHLCYKPHTVLT